MNNILKVKNPCKVCIFTAQGPVNLPDFPYEDQLRAILGVDDVFDTNPPNTPSVTALAHFMFKMCRNFFCPRLGNKSSFTRQDVVCVAMLMTSNPFELGSLILKKMASYSDKNDTGFPYGLLLTRIFESLKIELKTAAKVPVKESIDHKVLTNNNLTIEDGELIRLVPPAPDSPLAAEPSSAIPSSDMPNAVSLIQSQKGGNSLLLGRFIGLSHEVQSIKASVKQVQDELQVMKTVMQSCEKKMLTQFTGQDKGFRRPLIQEISLLLMT